MTITKDSKDSTNLSYPDIKTEFEEIKKKAPPRQTIEKNDANFFSIKESVSYTHLRAHET